MLPRREMIGSNVEPYRPAFTGHSRLYSLDLVCAEQSSTGVEFFHDVRRSFHGDNASAGADGGRGGESVKAEIGSGVQHGVAGFQPLFE